MVRLTEAGASFVISVNPKTILRLFDINKEFKNLSDIHTIKPLIFPEIKELVSSRLNETRTKKSDSLAPFNEEDIREIWKKSRGNPRMVLLILANLYDIKMAKS
jgi:predicted ATPase